MDGGKPSAHLNYIISVRVRSISLSGCWQPGDSTVAGEWIDAFVRYVLRPSATHHAVQTTRDVIGIICAFVRFSYATSSEMSESESELGMNATDFAGTGDKEIVIGTFCGGIFCCRSLL